MSELGDVLQVVDDTGHDGTGFVLIEVGERHLVQMGEDLAAHIRLHTHTHNMTLELHDVLHPSLEAVDQQQNHRPDHDEIQLFVGNVVVDDGAGHHRVNQTAGRRQQGTEHVQREQFQMRFVVRNETFEHFSRLLFCLMLTIILFSWEKSKNALSAKFQLRFVY